MQAISGSHLVLSTVSIIQKMKSKHLVFSGRSFFFEGTRENILHIFRAPDLTDHYNNSAASAMIHHGASGPLLSSAMANNTQQPHQTASNQQPAVHGQGGPGQAGQNNSAKHSHRHNITDYSPDWAWSDVSRIWKRYPKLTRMISAI